MCFRWGIGHLSTTSYYPQRSLAELVNGNLKSALKIFHHETQNLWDDGLPWLGLAFKTAVHDSTGSTPDILFLGREVKSPLQVWWDLPPKVMTMVTRQVSRGGPRPFVTSWQPRRE